MKIAYSLQALVVIELITLTLFYSSYIFGSTSFYFADATFWLQPMAQYISDSFRQHRIPLWNTLCYCGMPQLAITFPNLLYPPDVLFIIFPFSTALALSMVFHQTLAAVGMYLLVRSMQEPAPSAIAAALIYSLSGYMFALPSNHSLVAGAAWFAIAFWALRHLEFVPSRRLPLQTLLGASSVYMLFASGRPEIFVPSYLILACYVLRNFLRRKANQNGCLYWQIRVLFLGVCFSLPTLLPTFEWLSMSRRALGLQAFEVFMYSASWYDLLTAVIGQVLGDLRLYGTPFRPLVSPLNIPPYLSCAFIGGVAVTLAMFGMFARAWRIKWTLLVLLVVTLVASLGNNTLVMPQLVETIPAFGFIRFPVKVLFLAVFVFSILAARGMTLLMQRDAPVKVSFCAWSVVLVTAIVWMVLADRGVEFAQFGGFSKAPLVVLEAQKKIGVGSAFTAILGFVVTGLGCLSKRSVLIPQIITVAILTLLSVTLLFNAVVFERLAAAGDYYQKPSLTNDRIADFQRSDINPKSRVMSLCLELLTVPNYYLKGSQEDCTVATSQYDREILRPNTHVNFGLASSSGFEGTMRGDYFHLLLYAYFQSSQSLHPSIEPPSDAALACFSKVTNTGFVVTQAERRMRTGKMAQLELLSERYFKLLFEDRIKNIRIFRVKEPLPRVYLSHAWKEASHNQVIEGILSPDLRKFSPEEVTWLEPGASTLPPAKQSGSQGSLEFWQPSPESLIVNCNTDELSVLVVADQPYPGWVASIDGVPTSIITANGFNRAVFVPPGQHQVLFKYFPNSFILGVSLAGLSLLLLGYLFWKHNIEMNKDHANDS